MLVVLLLLFKLLHPMLDTGQTFRGAARGGDRALVEADGGAGGHGRGGRRHGSGGRLS